MRYDYNLLERCKIDEFSKKAPKHYKVPYFSKWLYFYVHHQWVMWIMPVYILCYPVAVLVTLINAVVEWNSKSVVAYWVQDIEIADKKLTYIFRKKAKADLQDVVKVHKNNVKNSLFLMLLMTAAFLVAYILDHNVGEMFLLSFFKLLF